MKVSYKEYSMKEIEAKKYAVISYDYEDGTYAICSLHDDEEKAHKRCKFLNKKNNIDISIVDYVVKSTDDKCIKRAMNIEGRD